MTNRLNAWARSVHEYCRRHKVSVTVEQAVAACGMPPAGSSPPRKLLERARDKGFFSSERSYLPGGPRGRWFIAVYTAVGPPPLPLRSEERGPRRRGPQSYFDGVTRATSIFDLAKQCNSETTK